MLNKKTYNIVTKIWLWKGGKAAWHFVSIPKEISDEIKFFSHVPKVGWGSVRVSATIGKIMWNTSIFPYEKEGGYILPIKAEVRKKEKIGEGDDINLELEILG